MKLRAGLWDGAQPRTHVLDVLRSHGVEVLARGNDYFELVDVDGDPEVIHIPNPVMPETIVHLYRRFGALHDFAITDLVRKPRPN